jgi:hypothetical protein
MTRPSIKDDLIVISESYDGAVPSSPASPYLRSVESPGI